MCLTWVVHFRLCGHEFRFDYACRASDGANLCRDRDYFSSDRIRECRQEFCPGEATAEPQQFRIEWREESGQYCIVHPSYRLYVFTTSR